MTWPSFLGCALIAFGPSFSLIYFVVVRRPQLVIVALLGYVRNERAILDFNYEQRVLVVR